MRPALHAGRAAHLRGAPARIRLVASPSASWAIGQGEPHQHRLALQRPHLRARARQQAGADLGGLPRHRAGPTRFDDLRVLSNTHRAATCAASGLEPGERDLPVHGPRPRAVHRLPRHPQDGRHRAAAVLRLRRGLAVDAPRRRRHRRRSSPRRKHLPKVRRIRERLPELRHVIVVDAGGAPLQERRDRASPSTTSRACERFDVYPADAGDAVGAALHLRHHRASPRARSTSTTRSSRSTSRPSGCSTCGPTTSTGATPIPAG